jgi:uncharacterized protein (TIGR00645 family)
MTGGDTLPPRDVIVPKSTPVVRAIARLLFVSRWLMAPFYLGLVLALTILLFDFGRQMVQLVMHLNEGGHDPIIVGILGLIDLSLMANLVLMVMFAGYESFVAKLHVDDHADRLDWMGQIGFGDLKLKLMTSIIAISAIRLLESFMDVENKTQHDLAWTVGIHVTFVVSGLLLALMERMMHK